MEEKFFKDEIFFFLPCQVFKLIVVVVGMASAVNDKLIKFNYLIGKNDSIVKSTRPTVSDKIWLFIYACGFIYTRCLVI